MPHEVVPDRKRRRAREREDDPEPLQMLRPVLLPRKEDAPGDNEHGAGDQRRPRRLAEEEERDRDRHERRRAEDHRDARRTRIPDRDRDEDLGGAERQEAREQKRPGRLEVKPACRLLSRGCDERHDNGGAGGRERGARYGLYAPSSACSGVFLPWAKSGTNK
jgi:hypothetical protein